MLPFNDLVSRVIRQESGGDPNAVNPKSGASGLMQIMPATAASPGFGVAPLDWSKRFDGAENRRFGEQYMKAMIDRYGGDQAKALAAYNWGPGNADRWDGNLASLPDETRNYINSILGGAAGQQPASPPQGVLGEVMAEAAPETLKLFGWDTGSTEEEWGGLAQALEPQQMQQMQAPQMQRGQGFQRQTDSLARALEAFQMNKQRRA